MWMLPPGAARNNTTKKEKGTQNTLRSRSSSQTLSAVHLRVCTFYVRATDKKHFSPDHMSSCERLVPRRPPHPPAASSLFGSRRHGAAVAGGRGGGHAAAAIPAPTAKPSSPSSTAPADPPCPAHVSAAIPLRHQLRRVPKGHTGVEVEGLQSAQ